MGQTFACGKTCCISGCAFHWAKTRKGRHTPVPCKTYGCGVWRSIQLCRACGRNTKALAQKYCKKGFLFCFEGASCKNNSNVWGEKVGRFNCVVMSLQYCVYAVCNLKQLWRYDHMFVKFLNCVLGPQLLCVNNRVSFFITKPTNIHRHTVFPESE